MRRQVDRPHSDPAPGPASTADVAAPAEPERPSSSSAPDPHGGIAGSQRLPAQNRAVLFNPVADVVIGVVLSAPLFLWPKLGIVANLILAGVLSKYSYWMARAILWTMIAAIVAVLLFLAYLFFAIRSW